MRQRLTPFFLFAALAVFALGTQFCKRTIEQQNTAFYGVWYHFDQANGKMEKLVLVDDSSSSYQICTVNGSLPDCCRQDECYDCAVQVSGEALLNKRYIYIGKKGKFKIDKEPWFYQNAWYMEVDGKTYEGRYFENCTDGYKNRDEERIDCGGCYCSPCPTCNDGLKNQGERKVDCGGTSCNSCFDAFTYELSFVNTSNFTPVSAKTVKVTSRADTLTITANTGNAANDPLVLKFLPDNNSFYWLLSGSRMGKYKLSSGKLTPDIINVKDKTMSGSFELTLEYTTWSGGAEGVGDPTTNWAYIKKGVFTNILY